MIELLIIVLIIGLLLSAVGGPRFGWWAGAGLVSVILWVLFILAVIWLISAVVGGGFGAGFNS